MATQRYISTSFWDDAWIQELDPSEKLLFLYLMTNPLTNIAGVYKITMRRMVFDTGFNEDTVNRVLTRFEHDGKVYAYKEFIIIPSWPKHQKWNQRAKIRNGIISILQDLPKEIINYANEVGYEFDLQLIDNTIIARKERVGISGSKRKKIVEKVNSKCEICGKEDNIEIHHKVAIKDGGDNSEENLIVLCAKCHKERHSPHTLYGPGNQSTKVHNYSEFDSDINRDSDKEKKAYAETVYLTEKQYTQLTTKFHEKDVKKKILALDAYQENKKAYKNHYKTLLNWLAKDCEEKKLRECPKCGVDLIDGRCPDGCTF